MLVTFVGAAAEVLLSLRSCLRGGGDRPSAAALVRAIRAHASALPAVYACEWTDYWLVGGEIFRERRCSVQDEGLELAILTPGDAARAASQVGTQWDEQKHFALRLRESSDAYAELRLSRAIVFIREAVGPSPTDEEIVAASAAVPEWLRPVQ